MSLLSIKEIALRKSSEYFGGDELAPDVFMKYALRDQNDNLLETYPDDMHHRLAKEFARIESKYQNPMSENEIYSLIQGFQDIIPQGSPMSGIGNPYQLQSLSNCFVIDSPHDSYGGILFTDQEQVQIMKRRGGVGFDISTIRPKGQPTTNAAKTTDGIGIFMERFSNSTREVAQGGRRGALLLSIDCKHPEIETFIDIKRNLKKVTGANISIKWSDAFMNAVKNDEEFTLCWPVTCEPKDAEITKVVKAKEIWNKYVDAAWASAEPGAFFWDRVKDNTPADIYKNFGYESVSSNPCGELVLCSYDSCRLMVVNLLSFVKNAFESNATFDFIRFNDVVIKAQRLMDDLVDLEIEVIEKILDKVKNDPEPMHVKQIELNLWQKIKEKCINGRRTGLGITGLGDAIAALGFRYGDDNSIEFTSQAYKALAVGAHTSSMILAKERGAFPIFDYNLEKDHVYMNKIIDACNENSNGVNYTNMWKTSGRRNIALTTTAPVGSVSILTQTTSGIEPAFLLSYKRRRKIVHNDTTSRVDFVDALGDKWQEYIVYHQGFKKWMEVSGKTDVKDSPYWGGTANDIDWVKSVDIQAAAQAWIDHSISKTINLPSNVTKEIVNDVYMRAWELGCKGATVYRDGSRDGVLVAADEKKETTKQEQGRIAQSRPKQLPCELHRANIRSTSPDGSITTESWLVLVGLLNGKPYEVFCGMPEMIEIPKKYKSGILIKNGKKDGVTTYNLEVPVGDDENLIFKDVVTLFNNKTQGSFTRTISLALRHEVPLHYVVEQLQKDKNGDMFSFGKVIARVLKSYIKDGTKASSVKCAQCGNTELVYQEGCLSCKNCGWGKCG